MKIIQWVVGTIFYLFFILILYRCTSTIIMVRESDNADINVISNDTISFSISEELKIDLSKKEKDTINQ